MIDLEALTVVIDGQPASLDQIRVDPLFRAVLSSIFTWARARPDDQLPGDDLMGYWGDTFPAAQGDSHGSRLWLLTRAALTDSTVTRAVEYVREALQWLLDDGVATAVTVNAERQGLDRLALGVLITRSESGQSINLRFADIWEAIRAY